MLTRPCQQAWLWPACWRLCLPGNALRQVFPETGQLPEPSMGWNARHWLHRPVTEVRDPQLTFGRTRALACHQVAPATRAT
jgi:hypothetical protein